VLLSLSLAALTDLAATVFIQIKLPGAVRAECPAGVAELAERLDPRSSDPASMPVNEPTDAPAVAYAYLTAPAWREVTMLIPGPAQVVDADSLPGHTGGFQEVMAPVGPPGSGFVRVGISRRQVEQRISTLRVTVWAVSGAAWQVSAAAGKESPPRGSYGRLGWPRIFRMVSASVWALNGLASRFTSDGTTPCPVSILPVWPEISRTAAPGRDAWKCLANSGPLQPGTDTRAPDVPAVLDTPRAFPYSVSHSWHVQHAAMLSAYSGGLMASLRRPGEWNRLCPMTERYCPHFESLPTP
jgi:hypothetical protein